MEIQILAFVANILVLHVMLRRTVCLPVWLQLLRHHVLIMDQTNDNFNGLLL